MNGDLMLYVSLLSFALGTIGLILNNNMIKKILALGITEVSTIVFYVAISARYGTRAPIVELPLATDLNYADPLPQAVIITGIVIGFALLCLSLVFTMLLYNKYHTVDVRLIEKLFEGEK